LFNGEFEVFFLIIQLLFAFE